MGTKGRKHKDLVVGKRVSQGLMSWKGADLTTNIYIGNVDVSTSTDDVKAGISAQGVEVVELEELKRNHNRFKSFRLCIRKSERPKITVPEFWPEGVIIRNFFWGKDPKNVAERVGHSTQS